MSDAAYDALRNQYDRLIREYPELETTPQVGAQPTGSAQKIDHTMPVLSLQKAYTDEAVDGFLRKCGTNRLYCIESKIDGLTVVLRYREGLLVQAITRGDGKSGTDATTAILSSGAVPIVLKNAPAQLEVRGEAFIPVAAFEALNHRRMENGLDALKSPRNTAAGTLALSDCMEVASRGLAIQLFDLIATDPMPPTHTAAMALMKSIGLPTIESRTVAASDVQRAVAELNRRRENLPFQTDGIVIRIDDLAAFERLGATSHHPRAALARKYKEIPVSTRLLDVEWSRGKTGKLTPVARFEPVEINGATLQQATLHNLVHIRAMDLKIGDTIEVIRAGGAVPEIIGIRSEKRTGTERPIPDPAL